MGDMCLQGEVARMGDECLVAEKEALGEAAGLRGLVFLPSSNLRL